MKMLEVSEDLYVDVHSIALAYFVPSEIEGERKLVVVTPGGFKLNVGKPENAAKVLAALRELARAGSQKSLPPGPELEPLPRKGRGKWGADPAPKHESPGPDRPPRTGRQLFAWAKKQEEARGPGLLKWLNGWAREREVTGRMVDWGADLVVAAYGEARRMLEESEVPNGVT